MSKIIEFPQTSELDKQFMTIEAQQKIIRDQAAKIKKLEDEKKQRVSFVKKAGKLKAKQSF